MARIFRHPKSKIYWFRKRIPDDLRSVLGKREEKWSLRTKDPEQAKLLHAAALIEVEQRWAKVRADRDCQPATKAELQADAPKRLSEREAHERALWMQSYWLQTHRDNPSGQRFWDTEAYRQLWKPLPLEFARREDGSLAVSEQLKIKKLEDWCLDEADNTAAVHSWILDDVSRLRLAKAIAASVQ